MAHGGREIAKVDSEGTNPQPIIYSDPAKGFYTQIHSAANVQFNGKMTVYMGSEGYKKKNIKPRKPVTKSAEPVTLDQLLDIKDRLGRDWKDLGRRFKFDDALLEQMQHDYRDNMSELNYQILSRWQRENPHQATQANLAKIFVAMCRGDLSDLLAEQEI
ncbi:unnamed protein product [Candidula unifasciata]|uniref:Death domain-containing protein n=1 Tax=Candidula unifasciata TaxID=100452 RepID=A0A8S3YH64_9EUPU|nr:unnamed protein product [Candidula unifasciata]